MKKSVELRKKLAELETEMKGILETAKTEKRDLSADEQTKFNDKYKDIEDLKVKITDAENVEAFEARMANNAPSIKTDKSKEAYTIMGHINAVRTGKVDGVYAEAQAEGEKELRNAGVAVNANAVYIPSNFRNFTVTGDDGAKGGNLVETAKGGIIESLFEGSLLDKMGATRFLGLTGNLDLPKGGKVTSAWYTENGEVSAQSHNVGQIELRPNRLATRMNVSNQLLIQSSADVEAYLRNEIQKSIQKALDEKYIEYLLGADVLPVEMGVNGGAIDYAKVQEFVEKVGKAEADVANGKYLINYDLHSFLKTLKMDSGSGRFVLQDGKLDGFDFVVSNRVPSNLTKGTGTGLSAMAFGDWSESIVAGWGAIEILVDPYTRSQFGQTVMNVGSYWDLKDLRPEAKAVSKDIDA
ncbi:phage major capsid protein [Belliella pelovolcani]|uniref:Phage major capsid protein, HK97 family n=1 Tax=Belliella pelovolcani TaxID=529505 RepID=A0A1N7MRG1_9BACT|nr:phage major capsid protein [Belliella pelovolcani]SIS88652.1 phage major capsid protein, HK97 family [Belliella pelovolcani]